MLSEGFAIMTDYNFKIHQLLKFVILFFTFAILSVNANAFENGQKIIDNLLKIQDKNINIIKYYTNELKKTNNSDFCSKKIYESNNLLIHNTQFVSVLIEIHEKMIDNRDKNILLNKLLEFIDIHKDLIYPEYKEALIYLKKNCQTPFFISETNMFADLWYDTNKEFLEMRNNIIKKINN
jgi:hypothetical protein